MKYEDTIEYKLKLLAKETKKLKKEIYNPIEKILYKILDKIFKR